MWARLQPSQLQRLRWRRKMVVFLLRVRAVVLPAQLQRACLHRRQWQLLLLHLHLALLLPAAQYREGEGLPKPVQLPP